MKTTMLFFCIGLSAIAQEWNQSGNDIDSEESPNLTNETISLSDDGSILAIGTPFNSDNGEVRIFRNENDIWTQIGEDINGDNEESYFGISINLSNDGSVLAIGAPYDEQSIGEVKVFRNENDTWEQIGEDINGEFGDFLGGSVSLSSDGSVLAVATIDISIATSTLSSSVKIYNNENDNWIEVGEINGDDLNSIEGVTLNLNDDGSILAIGLAGTDSNDSSLSLVQLFENENNSWTQIGEDISGNYLSGSISLNAEGTVLAIGAIYESDDDSKLGKVQIYRNEGDELLQIGEDLDGTYSSGGISLSKDGNLLAVGTLEDGLESGEIQVFENENDTWVQLTEEGIMNYSGGSISLNEDGSILAFEAAENDNNYVRVYEFVDTSLSLNDNLLSIEAFKVYPNPTAEELNVNMPDVIIKKALLYDLQGVLVSAETYNENIITIPVQNLSNGTYVVKIETDKGEVTKQFIKK